MGLSIPVSDGSAKEKRAVGSVGVLIVVQVHQNGVNIVKILVDKFQQPISCTSCLLSPGPHSIFYDRLRGGSWGRMRRERAGRHRMKHLMFGLIHRRGGKRRSDRTRPRLCRWEHLEWAGKCDRVGIHIVILEIAVVFWDGNRCGNEQRFILDQSGPVSDGRACETRMVLPFLWRCQRTREVVRRGGR